MGTFGFTYLDLTKEIELLGKFRVAIEFIHELDRKTLFIENVHEIHNRYNVDELHLHNMARIAIDCDNSEHNETLFLHTIRQVRYTPE